MKLHNTLTRKTEDFKPLDGNTVRMYSCGPTVYNHAHIGNLSSYIYADTLRRVLALSDYEVQHVMNLTDVEDKIIRRSQELYPDDSPEDAMSRLTKEYGQLFKDDMVAIGNDTVAMKFVLATESIEGMRALITDLHQDGFAYIADGSVYFSIQKYKESGKKYGQLIEINSENTSNARIDNDEYDKESVHDFALWKAAKPNEPSWPFELNGQDLQGRPGWHIECSVMSVNSLGQPFDIHTGGVDLVFPHHENEIAQSTAGKGDTYAKYFVHNEHMMVEGKKMSKSLGNFYTLQDVKERGFEPLAFRLMVLQSHYQNQSNFTWGNLEAAQNRLADLSNFADLKHQSDDNAGSLGTTYFKELQQSILAAAQSNLNTPEVFKLISEAVSHVYAYGKGLSPVNEAGHVEFLVFLDKLLGLDISDRPDITKEQKNILVQRQKARDNKDFAASDKLRDQLNEQGIGVRDAAQGQVWYRL